MKEKKPEMAPKSRKYIPLYLVFHQILAAWTKQRWFYFLQISVKKNEFRQKPEN